MPPHPEISNADARTMARYILSITKTAPLLVADAGPQLFQFRYRSSWADEGGPASTSAVTAAALPRRTNKPMHAR